MTREELLDWMKHGAQLTQDLIGVAPKLIERGQMTEARLRALQKQVEIERKVLNAEATNTTDSLNKMEQIWRTYMHRYAEIHVDCTVGTEEFYELSVQARNERGDAIRALIAREKEQYQ